MQAVPPVPLTSEAAFLPVLTVVFFQMLQGLSLPFQVRPAVPAHITAWLLFPDIFRCWSHWHARGSHPVFLPQILTHARKSCRKDRSQTDNWRLYHPPVLSQNSGSRRRYLLYNRHILPIHGMSPMTDSLPVSLQTCRKVFRMDCRCRTEALLLRFRLPYPPAMPSAPPEFFHFLQTSPYRPCRRHS